MRALSLLAFAAASIELAGCMQQSDANTSAESGPLTMSCHSPQRDPTPLGRAGMAWVPGGLTGLGSEHFHPEERPLRKVQVAGFWIDEHEVTNSEFAAFVKATGYVTYAERDANGAAVFAPPLNVEGRSDISQWWRIDPEATWRRPLGAGSSNKGRDNYPAVNVTYDDALAYARWRGRDLPSEAEWERAARGGIADADYTWGDDPRPNGRELANHWEGVFPVLDTGDDGFKGLAPVECYPANGYGLYDMTGNVWEMVKDRWSSADPGAPANAHVIKGGSYLCSDDFCLRYRPAARQPGDPTLGAAHIGFRTVWRGPPLTNQAKKIEW